MTKSELIAHIAARNPHLYQRDVERIVTSIFEAISKALGRGDREHAHEDEGDGAGAVCLFVCDRGRRGRRKKRKGG